MHYRVVLLPVSFEPDVVPCSPAGELLRARAWPEVDPSGWSGFPPPVAEPVLGAAGLPLAGGVFMPSRGFMLLLLESDCAPGLTCGLLLSLYRSLQAPTDRPSTANTANAKIGGLIFPPEREVVQLERVRKARGGWSRTASPPILHCIYACEEATSGEF